VEETTEAAGGASAVRTVAVYRLHPAPGDVLDHIMPAGALPRVGQALPVVRAGDGARWTAHVSAVDREEGTYSVRIDEAVEGVDNGREM
jgi:hypothetical protein